jgi:hypothetical protein
MAHLETRVFGSTKHLLVILDNDEAELLEVLGKDEPVTVCGSVKYVDGWMEPYIELSKGVKTEEQVDADAMRNVKKLLKKGMTLAKKASEPGVSNIRRLELGLKAFELLVEMNEMFMEE